MAGAEENGDDLPIDLGSYKYKTLKDVPLGGLRDALELVATGAPTSLSLDTLVTCPDDLAIVIKTLDEQGTKQGKGAIEHHTVTAISMRYCSVFRQTGPQQEECVRLLCELINPLKPGAVKKVSSSAMPFKQRDNIAHYVEACVALGVPYRLARDKGVYPRSLEASLSLYLSLS